MLPAKWSRSSCATCTSASPRSLRRDASKALSLDCGDGAGGVPGPAGCAPAGDAPGRAALECAAAHRAVPLASGRRDSWGHWRVGGRRAAGALLQERPRALGADCRPGGRRGRSGACPLRAVDDRRRARRRCHRRPLPDAAESALAPRPGAGRGLGRAGCDAALPALGRGDLPGRRGPDQHLGNRLVAAASSPVGEVGSIIADISLLLRMSGERSTTKGQYSAPDENNTRSGLSSREAQPWTLQREESGAVTGLKSSWRKSHDELDADWDDRGTAVSAGGLCDGEGQPHELGEDVPGARRQLRFGSANVLGQYEEVRQGHLRVDGWHVRLEYTVLQRRRRLNEPNARRSARRWLNRLKRLIQSNLTA